MLVMEYKGSLYSSIVCPNSNFGVLSTTRPMPGALLQEEAFPQATGTVFAMIMV